MYPLLEKLFKEIEHGDAEHRKWLYDKLEDFSKREFKPYHCDGHLWERDPYDICFICVKCGLVTEDMDGPLFVNHEEEANETSSLQ